jgi:hypothetical protein
MAKLAYTYIPSSDFEDEDGEWPRFQARGAGRLAGSRRP